jgi:hypothetical protein
VGAAEPYFERIQRDDARIWYVIESARPPGFGDPRRNRSAAHVPDGAITDLTSSS